MSLLHVYHAFAQAMHDAGLPYASLDLDGQDEYREEATPEQIAQGQAIHAAHVTILEAAKVGAANEAIRQQLDALDARYGTRAITDALNGDRTRLDWLEAEKAALRAQFV